MYKTITIILAACCCLPTVSADEQLALSASKASNIRLAQDLILRRIVHVSQVASPEELLRLSQTLLTLQSAEGSNDVMQVLRAVEPQLEALPDFVQSIQREFMISAGKEMFQEMDRTGNLNIFAEGFRIWAQSLNAPDEAQKLIEEFDAESLEELEPEELPPPKAEELPASKEAWKSKTLLPEDVWSTPLSPTLAGSEAETTLESEAETTLESEVEAELARVDKWLRDHERERASVVDMRWFLKNYRYKLIKFSNGVVVEAEPICQQDAKSAAAAPARIARMFNIATNEVAMVGYKFYFEVEGDDPGLTYLTSK